MKLNTLVVALSAVLAAAPALGQEIPGMPSNVDPAQAREMVKAYLPQLLNLLGPDLMKMLSEGGPTGTAGTGANPTQSTNSLVTTTTDIPLGTMSKGGKDTKAPVPPPDTKYPVPPPDTKYPVPPPSPIQKPPTPPDTKYPVPPPETKTPPPPPPDTTYPVPPPITPVQNGKQGGYTGGTGVAGNGTMPGGNSTGNGTNPLTGPAPAPLTGPGTGGGAGVDPATGTGPEVAPIAPLNGAGQASFASALVLGLSALAFYLA